VAFNDDCGVVATGSYDKTVLLFDTRSQNNDPIQTLSHARDSVSSVCIRGHLVVSASIDGGVRQYDLRMGTVTEDLMTPAVTSVRLSNDNNCLLVGCLDSTVRLLDKSDGTVLNSYRGHRNVNFKIDAILTPDDAHVFAGSEDNNVYAWDLVDAKQVAVLRGHTREVLCVAHHPSQPLLLSGSSDATIKVWLPR
jgi:mitogen-activated protein kinase organizer 1